MRRLALLLVPLLAGGCVARAAWDVATLPVRAGAKTVDVLTVSEKERDEKYVRQQRKLAEAREKEQRRQAKADRQRRDDD